MGAGASNPNREPDGRAASGSFEDRGDEERQMPRSQSQPIRDMGKTDPRDAPSELWTEKTRKEPSGSLHKTDSTLLREMERQELNELSVQSKAIHLLETNEGTGETETHGRWHDTLLPSFRKKVSQWAHKRTLWEQGKSFGDAAWNAHTAALCTSATSVVNVEETMNVFAYLDRNRDGRVDIEELLKAGESPYVRRLLRSSRNFVLVSLMRSMEDPVRFRELFAEIDEDNDGVIEEEEWRDFIQKLAHERIRYLKCKGLTSGRCFWGRGWKQDYYYHLCNNHPLLQFFLRDPDYPCTTCQLILKELVVLSYMMYAVAESFVLTRRAIGRRPRCDAEGPYFKERLIEYGITVGVVTVPCLVLNQMLFHLFVCPCYVFENQRDPLQQRWHKIVKCGFVSSQIVAAYFILVNAAAAWSAFDRMNSEYQCFFEFFIMGQFNKYAYFPLMIFVQQFNPYVHSVSVCRWTGIGKYNVEKRHARSHALRKAKSMREHIGLLRDEVKDVSSSLHKNTFFVDQADRSESAMDLDIRGARRVRYEGGDEMEAMHHLDAIVAHHEDGDTHTDHEVDLPPSLFSGSGAGSAAAAGVIGGGVAAGVAAALAGGGGALDGALCRV